MSVRSFLAIDIPEGVRSNLAGVIHDLKNYDEDVSWTDPTKFHITVRFFGDIEEDLLLGEVSDTIAVSISQAKPTLLECSGVGVFPNWKYPRVIWAGFVGDTDPVIRLHDDIDDALLGFSLQLDERAFRLHLTIGRCKSTKKKASLVKRVENLGVVSFGDVPINELTLYRSELTSAGAVYTALKTFKIGES